MQRPGKSCRVSNGHGALRKGLLRTSKIAVLDGRQEQNHEHEQLEQRINITVAARELTEFARYPATDPLLFSATAPVEQMPDGTINSLALAPEASHFTPR